MASGKREASINQHRHHSTTYTEAVRELLGDELGGGAALNEALRVTHGAKDTSKLHTRSHHQHLNMIRAASYRVDCSDNM